MNWHYSARVKMTRGIRAEVPHRSSNGHRSVHSKRKWLRLGLAGKSGHRHPRECTFIPYLMAPCCRCIKTRQVAGIPGTPLGFIEW